MASVYRIRFDMVRLITPERPIARIFWAMGYPVDVAEHSPGRPANWTTAEPINKALDIDGALELVFMDGGDNRELYRSYLSDYLKMGPERPK